MKTAAVLVSILLMLFMIPGCSEFNRNDPADHAGHKNDGIEIPGDTPSDPNGDGGQMDETGSNDEGLTIRAIMQEAFAPETAMIWIRAATLEKS